MELVRATIGDVDDLAKLEFESFASPWTKEQYLYEIQNNEFATIWLLKENDKLLGYIDYWLLFDQGEINKICVLKDMQGQGLGSKLMQMALDELYKNGAFSLTLEVRVSNEKAIKFYEKYGFEIKVRKKNYYTDGEDCYMMMKLLGGI